MRQRFEIVTNGEDALSTFASERPKIILMDISMSGMDGLEVTRRIRSLFPQSKTVIIGMTNHFLNGDRIKCITAGMDDYVIKPRTAEQLTGHLEGWLNHSFTPLKQAS